MALALWWTACASPLQPKDGPCRLTRDCLNGLKCIQSQCSDGRTNAPCTTDTDCRPSYVCQQQRCVSRTDEGPTDGPRESAERDAGLPESQEERSAEIAPDTPPSDAIPPFPDAPVEECLSHQDCPQGSWCLIQADGASLRCGVPARSCRSHSDCRSSPGTFCQLLSRGPQSLLYCLHPQRTEQPRKGTGGSCTQADDCESHLCLPTRKECGGFCDDNNDCPSGFYCGTYAFAGHAATFGGCLRACRDDAQCPSGYRCSTQSRCEPQGTPRVGRACRKPDDCPTGGDCLDGWDGGYCVLPCHPTARACGGASDPPCPTGQSCRLDPTSQTLRCTPDCPAGSVCTPLSPRRSYCLQQCQASTDCRTSYFCAASSTSDRVCWPRGERTLGNLCEYDTDCQEGLCRPFPTGRYCTQRCSDTRTCPPRYACRTLQSERLCEKQCTTNGDCPTGHQCQNRACQVPPPETPRSIGESCTQDSHCQSKDCRTSLPSLPHGICTRTCSAQQPCPTGSYCAALGGHSLCLKVCQADSDCGRKSYICAFHPIPVGEPPRPLSCDANTPCPKLGLPWTCHTDWSGSLCAQGLCLGRGVRQAGQTCTQALECHSGRCYRPGPPPATTACTADSDCPPATPRCHPTQKQCVACLNFRDCALGLRCLQNRCMVGGYCVEPCAPDALPCPQQTTCDDRRPHPSAPPAHYCLPTCTSSLQCLPGFACRNGTSTPVCTLR